MTKAVGCVCSALADPGDGLKQPETLLRKSSSLPARTVAPTPELGVGGHDSVLIGSVGNRWRGKDGSRYLLLKTRRGSVR